MLTVFTKILPMVKYLIVYNRLSRTILHL